MFLLLHQELNESNIPGCTTIQNRIKTAFQTHMEQLGEEMKVFKLSNFLFCFQTLTFLQKSVEKISFTTDAWSDPNQTSFMGVTAHWIEAIEEQTPSGPQKRLCLQADLVGFHQIPGCHTGEHLAHCFLFIIDCLKLAGKASTSSRI